MTHTKQQPYKHEWWAYWLAPWVGLLESIVGILTLGHIRPSWQLKFWCWIVTKVEKRFASVVEPTDNEER